MKTLISAKESRRPGRLLPLLGLLLFHPASVPADEAAAATTAPAATAANSYLPDENTPPSDGRQKQKPRIEDLGNGRYRVGAITIDKKKRLITASGVMLPYGEGKAIEFFAATKQGYKSYESVVALNANAFEFNLACILIGLDAGKAAAPKFHFDPNPLNGSPVAISVSWQKGGKTVERDAAELLTIGDSKPKTPSQWSYTGSMFVGGDQYLAEMDGVLIGLIHDPSSIIEHRSGLGAGQWGAVMVDPAHAPESGQAITVRIKAK